MAGRIVPADYEIRPMSNGQRARLSAIHRRRWGAPEGCATVRGIHIPFEYRDPIRYWSDWLAYHDGEDAARVFIQKLKDTDWRDMPRVRRLYNARKDVAAMRDEIRDIEWRFRHGNLDHP